MIRTVLPLLLLLININSTAQDRASIEASRLEILNKIEKTEISLTRISKTKQSLLKEISQIESGGMTTRLEQSNEDLDDNTQRLEALNNEASTLQETYIEEDVSESSYADFSEIMMLQEQLLQKKVRAEQLYREGYKETDKLADAMINDRHLIQLTSHINERQNSEIAMARNPAIPSLQIEIQEEEEEEEEEEELIYESLPTSLVLPSTDRTSEEIFQEISVLTDEESKIRLKKNILENELNNLNQVYDAVLRQSSNFGSASNSNSVGTRGITKNKGFLPWPVNSAIISQRFGPQNDSGTITHQGISIKSSDPSVTSIYDGIVESIETRKGQKTITIRHDDRTTSLYRQLSTVLVNEGESIFKNQQLGTFNKEMQFELWQNNSPQNPLHWLQNN